MFWTHFSSHLQSSTQTILLIDVCCPSLSPNYTTGEKSVGGINISINLTISVRTSHISMTSALERHRHRISCHNYKRGMLINLEKCVPMIELLRNMCCSNFDVGLKHTNPNVYHRSGWDSLNTPLFWWRMMAHLRLMDWLTIACT